MTVREQPWRLTMVKVVHTVVWVFFGSCVVLIPVAAWMNRFALAGVLIGFVLLEVAILAVNSWRCPLTGVAARYTEARQDNFDIYLPLWLARYNKQIFGTLFLLGVLFTMIRWIG